MRAFFLAVFATCLLVGVSFAAEMSQSKSTKADPSFAHIVVKSSNFVDATNSQTKGSPGEFISLPEIASKTMRRYYGIEHKKANCPSFEARTSNAEKADSDKSKPKTMNEFADSLNVESKFKEAAGVFVTLSSKGKTRACWGSVYPREATIAREVVLATLGALSKDYRFKPISAAELKNLKVQVTVIRGLEAVSNVKMINPFKDGIMVRSGGRGGVILPGEAVDAHYEFVLARLKAGISPEQPCQIYKIRAEIYD